MEKKDVFNEVIQVRCSSEMKEYAEARGRELGGAAAWLRAIILAKKENDCPTICREAVEKSRSQKNNRPA
jgi:hypothetical protein